VAGFAGLLNDSSFYGNNMSAKYVVTGQITKKETAWAIQLLAGTSGRSERSQDANTLIPNVGPSEQIPGRPSLMKIDAKTAAEDTTTNSNRNVRFAEEIGFVPGARKVLFGSLLIRNHCTPGRDTRKAASPR